MTQVPIAERLKMELRMFAVVMKYPRHLDRAISLLRRNYFVKRSVFDALDHIRVMRDGGKPIDDVHYVLSRLQEIGYVREDVTPDRMTLESIHECYDEAVDVNVEFYIDSIAEWGRSDELVHLLTTEKQNAQDYNPDDVSQRLLGKLQELLSRAPAKEVFLGDAVVSYAEKRRKEQAQKRLPALGTGLREVDALTNGLPCGELIILGGRPSQGKSALGMQFLVHNQSQGRRCVFISMEMTVDNIASRLLARKVGFSIHNRILYDHELDAIDKAAFEEHSNRLRIYHGDFSANEIKSIATALHREGELDLLCVDYLGLIRAHDTRASSLDRIKDSLTKMVSIAKDLEIPVLLLAQVNRSGDDAPKLSNLRGSGDIEADADVVFLLNNAAKDDQNPNERRNCDLIVAKSRNTSKGTVKMVFDPQTTWFENLAEQPPLDY